MQTKGQSSHSISRKSETWGWSTESNAGIAGNKIGIVLFGWWELYCISYVQCHNIAIITWAMILCIDYNLAYRCQLSFIFLFFNSVKHLQKCSFFLVYFFFICLTLFYVSLKLHVMKWSSWNQFWLPLSMAPLIWSAKWKAGISEGGLSKLEVNRTSEKCMS